MLKFWDLVLNYICPNKSVFYCFYGFVCDFLEFPSVKSSNIFTVYCFQGDTNFKHEKSIVCKGSFFDFFQFYVFYRFKNPGLIDFPAKRAPTKVKDLLLICQIYRRKEKEEGRKSKERKEGNARKFTVSFAFCAHVDAIKYSKTLTVSFERVQIT